MALNMMQGQINIIVEKRDTLKELGFNIFGDSAHTLRLFLITTYDNAQHGTARENFNFFHLLCCIYVKCAFGEIDRRWGIS